MAKFREKPVVIEAVQFTDEYKDRVANWITRNTAAIFIDDRPALKIQTPEGVMIANLGDWVIRDVEGAFRPCKPDIFTKTYEPVEE